MSIKLRVESAECRMKNQRRKTEKEIGNWQSGEGDARRARFGSISRAGLQLVHGDQFERGFGELCFHFGQDVLDGQTIFLPEVFDVGGVLDELIGPANLHDGSGNSFFVEEL